MGCPCEVADQQALYTAASRPARPEQTPGAMGTLPGSKPAGPSLVHAVSQKHLGEACQAAACPETITPSGWNEVE